MIIKVLGTGCAKCSNLEKQVTKLIEKNGIDALVQKVTDLQEIMRYRVMMTPGLVINEKVVSFGTIPSDSQILKWIEENK